MSYNIPLPVNESRWQYQTASGGGLTVVMVAGSGGSNEGQQTLSLGVRWDFTKNMDAKVQFDHTRFKGNSVGPLINPQPDFTSGGSLNVISLAVDFVF